MSTPKHIKTAIGLRSQGSCEVQYHDNCTGIANPAAGPHHLLGRGQCGPNNVNNEVDICFICHYAITNHYPDTDRWRLQRWPKANSRVMALERKNHDVYGRYGHELIGSPKGVRCKIALCEINP